MSKRLKTIPKLASEAAERAFSLRLPRHLLDSIKIAANARGVPYQSLIKVWLQEKLQGS
jgi:predicted DNA binding CopG/RHH family protein